MRGLRRGSPNGGVGAQGSSHCLAECSKRGTCDAGVCRCSAGYFGKVSQAAPYTPSGSHTPTFPRILHASKQGISIVGDIWCLQTRCCRIFGHGTSCSAHVWERTLVCILLEVAPREITTLFSQGVTACTCANLDIVVPDVCACVLEEHVSSAYVTRAPLQACERTCPGGASTPCKLRGTCDSTTGRCRWLPGYCTWPLRQETHNDKVLTKGL